MIPAVRDVRSDIEVFGEPGRDCAFGRTACGDCR